MTHPNKQLNTNLSTYLHDLKVDCREMRDFKNSVDQALQLGGVLGLIRWLLHRRDIAASRAFDPDVRAETKILIAVAWETALSRQARILHEWVGPAYEAKEVEARMAEKRRLLAEREQQRRRPDLRAELQTRLATLTSPLSRLPGPGAGGSDS